MWEALNLKTELLLCVDRVGISNDVSSDDILKRMVQAAGGAVKVVSSLSLASTVTNIQCIVYLKLSSSKQR